MTKLKPIHPGEILREEFVVPFGLNANKLALALRVPPPTVKEERGIDGPAAGAILRHHSRVLDKSPSALRFVHF